MRNNSYSSGRRFSTAEREQLVAKYQGSGLTQREFAVEHGLKLGTFQQWIYRPGPKRRLTARTAKTTFQEVSLGEVGLLNGWAAELQLAGGRALRLNGHARPEWVAALVQELGQIC